MRPKKILITGGCRGLGLELAKIYLEKNFIVFVTSRSKENIDEAKKNIRSKYLKNFITLKSELSNLNSSNEIIHYFKKNNNLDFFDIIINNACKIIIGKFSHIPIEQYEEANIVNFLTPIKFIKYVLNENTKTIVINIIGGNTNFGMPFSTSYSTSKSALEMFSDCIKHELHNKNIKIITLHPGPIDTKSNDNKIFYNMNTDPFRSKNEKDVKITALKIVNLINKDKNNINLSNRSKIISLLNFVPFIKNFLLKRIFIKYDI